MHSAILTMVVTLVPADGTLSYRGKARKGHPLAPSIPQLTKEEYAKIERVINRFILYDIGKLKGDDGKKALRDFEDLGPESFFLLVESLNRAANFKASCPAVVIGRKLGKIIRTTTDLELLSFAKENIGIGVTARRHMGVIKDLRAGVIVRTGTLKRLGYGQTGAIAMRRKSLESLSNEAIQARGTKLNSLLQELERRGGSDATDALAKVAARKDRYGQQAGRTSLTRHLARQKIDFLKALAKKSDDPEVLAAVAYAAAYRRYQLLTELVEMLSNENVRVHQAARQALARLTGRDFGPQPTASSTEREATVQQWRSLLSKSSRFSQR